MERVAPGQRPRQSRVLRAPPAPRLPAAAVVRLAAADLRLRHLQAPNLVPRGHGEQGERRAAAVRRLVAVFNGGGAARAVVGRAAAAAGSAHGALRPPPRLLPESVRARRARRQRRRARRHPAGDVPELGGGQPGGPPERGPHQGVAGGGGIQQRAGAAVGADEQLAAVAVLDELAVLGLGDAAQAGGAEQGLTGGGGGFAAMIYLGNVHDQRGQ